MRKTLKKMLGMERTRLIIACFLTIGLTIVVISTTVVFLNMQPSPNPTTDTDIVVSGEITCLPHKATDAPQTLACATGLRTDDNRYYALQDSSQTSTVDTRVTVRGKLNTSNTTVYDIAGTIKVTSLTTP